MRKLQLVSALIITLFFSQVVNSENIIAYDNFDPNNSYQPYSGLGVGGITASGLIYDSAVSFIPTSSGYLSDIWIALTLSNHANSNEFRIWIAADNNGLPGNAIESVVLSNEVLGQPNCCPLAPPVHISIESDKALVAGQQYWIVAGQAAQDSLAMWHRVDYSNVDNNSLRVDRNILVSNEWTTRNGLYKARGAFRIGVREPVIEVNIDIKPHDNNNSINLGSKGVTAVTIFSSEDFNANNIDVQTMTLSGATVKQANKKGRYMCHQDDVNGDGLLDVTCKFNTYSIEVQGDANSLTLGGYTVSGDEIRGMDIFETSMVPAITL
jgi:hypothetical protein